MTVEYTMPGRRRLRGQVGEQAEAESAGPASRPPRIACLLALAHRFDELVRSSAVKDYAELARLGHVTRARVTQIMNLLNLAPDLQECILWLPPRPACGITEREMRRIVGEVRWDRQRELFRHHGKKPPKESPGGEKNSGLGKNQCFTE
jgi:hypothetical protein